MKSKAKLNCCVAVLAIVYFLGWSSLGAREINAPERKTVEVNGAAIEYVEQGKGPLLILAHGAISDYRRWVKDHMPLLAKNFRVVSYSMRFHGTIEWEENWPELTLELYADDLAGFIQSFDVGPAHLVGWSMGSEVAHTTALKYPDLVRSVYLFEGVANIIKSPEDAEEERELEANMFGPVLAAHDSGDKAGAIRALIDGVGGRVGIYDGLPEASQEFLKTKSDVLAKYLEWREHESTAYECEQVLKSKVPTTLVMGTESVDFFQIKLLKHNLPCFGEDRITRIKDAGHLWPGRADEFVSSVTKFALSQ